jgi:hypothetical protein
MVREEQSFIRRVPQVEGCITIKPRFSPNIFTLLAAAAAAV